MLHTHTHTNDELLITSYECTLIKLKFSFGFFLLLCEKHNIASLTSIGARLALAINNNHQLGAKS